MTNDLGFLGWNAPEDQVEEVSLPYIQWFNGKAFYRSVSPLLASGGWELPFDPWGTILGNTHQVLDIPHGENNLEPGYILPVLHIAQIATRFTWEHWDGSQMQYSKTYQPGYRGRLNVFCLVKELGTIEPLMLTLKGMVGKAYGDTAKTFRNSVIKAAAQLGQNSRYPQYMFWMPVTVSSPVTVGSGQNTSQITPPTIGWDANAVSSQDQGAVANVLKSLYIGDELRDLIAGDLYAQGQEWRKQFNEPAQAQTQAQAQPPMPQTPAPAQAQPQYGQPVPQAQYAQPQPQPQYAQPVASGPMANGGMATPPPAPPTQPMQPQAPQPGYPGRPTTDEFFNQAVDEDDIPF